MQNKIPDNWYETFFTGTNCEMWEKAVTKEWTEAEVIFIEDILNVNKGRHLLDVPCGTGRHSIELAKHGYKVTGVDISDDFINRLKKKVEQQQLRIEIIHANILFLQLNTMFDGAFTLGNSFGYFNYPEMEKFSEEVSSHLKQGAKWIINTGLIAESFLAKFVKEKKYELEGLTMEINNDYDEWTSCLFTTLTYTRNNKQEVHQFKHHVYTIAEIIRLLGKFNLNTIGLYSSTDKKVFKSGDAQLYLVAEKI